MASLFMPRLRWTCLDFGCTKGLSPSGHGPPTDGGIRSLGRQKLAPRAHRELGAFVRQPPMYKESV